MARRVEALLVALLLAVGVGRISATWPVFSQTFDEPAHIAAGVEWLDRGTYGVLAFNPPLARIFEGLGPYLDGARFHFEGEAITTGNAILYGGDYSQRLTLARAGNLPFFVIGGLVVWLWARRIGGAIAGLASLALFTTMPLVLGHAGVATTDIAAAASVAAVLFVFTRFLDEPHTKHALLLGVSGAFALLSKFSTLFFVPAAALAIFILYIIRREVRWNEVPWKRIATGLLMALSVAAVLTWAMYRFSTVDPARVDELTIEGSPLRPLYRAIAAIGLPIPAPELLAGIAHLEAANRLGTYPAYFLGRVDPRGHPLFFPTLIAVRTPIAFLLLLGIAIAWSRRGDWRTRAPLAASVAILLCGFLVQTQGGLRYLLPFFGPAAVAAGVALSQLRREAAAILLALHIGPGVLAHPDYLPYFNLLAGAHPERIAVDSDLDWGQDLFRLEDAARELGVRELRLAYFGTALPWRHDLGVTVRPLRPHERYQGWIAISEAYRQPISTDGYLWLRQYQPVRRVGRSMWLYRIE